MKSIKLLVCLVLLCPMLLSISAGASEDSYEKWRNRFSLVGAWQVEVTVRFDSVDCATAAPVPFGPNPFPALYTFHEGGTVSESGSRSPPSARSPGIGVWRRTGQTTFDVRNTFQGFDANGFLATNMDIRSEIRLSQDGSAFTAVSRFAHSDISGNVTPFCATLDGARYAL